MINPDPANAAPSETAQNLTSVPRAMAGQTPIKRKAPPASNPKDRSWLSVAGFSIKYKLVPPVRIVLERRLLGLVQNEILEDQDVHFRSHEASICITRRTHKGLTTDIE